MNIKFPKYPKKERYIKNEEVRKSYLKSRAFWVFYLEESGIDEYDYSLHSAIMTAEAHNISLELNNQEYLEKTIEELNYLENIIQVKSHEDQQFKKKIKRTKNKLKTRYKN